MAYDGFDDFVLRGSPRLLASAVLLLGNRQAAEDLTQETLILVFRAWSTIRAAEAVDSYAYRTLVRLSHRYHRRASSRREFPTDQLPDQVAEVDDDYTNQDLINRVGACIPNLPARQRETLVLRFYAQLSVEETADAMACHTGTVKSQTAKGLSNLRQLIAVDRARELAQQGDET